ncbi:MAG: beta-ketoacyl-[acyl-carrier-protein] synthase family protein [Planctomycetota bacterium]
MRPRAVITGIGMVTPIGNSAETYWDSLLSGRSGIGPITLFDTGGSAVKIGGEVRDLDFSEHISPESSRKMSRASKLAVVAARMAGQDSAIEIDDQERAEIDVFMGVACMDFDTLATDIGRRLKNPDRRHSPLLAARSVTSAPAGNVSVVLGLRGEVTTISTACSSSTNALGHALRKIRSGDSKVIFAGGTDAAVQEDLVASFACGGNLSTRNCDPQRASRPFDAGRDGHVVSEAAAVLVLEEYEHARARGARIYAEVVGYGANNDAHTMYEVCPDETAAAACVRRTLDDAGRNAAEVDFYCAHGSSSRAADARETRMLKRALGNHAYRVPVSGIKSMIGHPFGASGAVQAASCALAISRGEIPPTINYEDPDPECDLDYVPNQAREGPVRLAVCYSLGMGNNAGLALAAC